MKAITSVLKGLMGAGVHFHLLYVNIYRVALKAREFLRLMKLENTKT
jgi:hypothetical protein